MKQIRWIGVLLLLALLLPQPATSEPNQGIIVNGADSILETGMSDPGVALPVAPRIIFEHANSSDMYSLLLMPEELRQRIEAVVPRIIFEHANSSDMYPLLLMPEELQLRLEQVVPRLTVEHANSTALRDFVEVPLELRALLEAVNARLLIEHANSTRTLELGYPCSILDDGVPPVISDVHATHVTAGSATIEWTTSEPATSMVLYRTESGSYGEPQGYDSYVEQHAVALTGLSQGTTYYYRVGSLDRCGSQAESGEYSFTTLKPIYLPVILKGS